MTLIKRILRAFDLLEQQQVLIEAQQRMITAQQHDRRALMLEHARELQGIVSAWRIHMETPEIDLRDDISSLAATIGHQVAVLEEHVL